MQRNNLAGLGVPARGRRARGGFRGRREKAVTTLRGGRGARQEATAGAAAMISWTVTAGRSGGGGAAAFGSGSGTGASGRFAGLGGSTNAASARLAPRSSLSVNLKRAMKPYLSEKMEIMYHRLAPQLACKLQALLPTFGLPRRRRWLPRHVPGCIVFRTALAGGAPPGSPAWHKARRGAFAWCTRGCASMGRLSRENAVARETDFAAGSRHVPADIFGCPRTLVILIVGDDIAYQ